MQPCQGGRLHGLGESERETRPPRDKGGMMKLYGLVSMIPDQLDIIEEFCFPKCGRLIIGGIDHKSTGPLFPCKVDSNDCPRFDQEIYMGQIDDEDGPVDVWVRRLK